jgi:hypothetical protein
MPVSVSAVQDTVRELEERIGPLYDLAALATYCQVGQPQLRRALERAGAPIISIGRKQLVPREIAEKALGFDFAEVLLEINRHERWMQQHEVGANGQRKTAAEYAEEMSAIARQALRRPSEVGEG